MLINTRNTQIHQNFNHARFGSAWNVAATWSQPFNQGQNLTTAVNFNQTNQQLAQGWQNFGGNPVRVAVIDDFVAEGNGFNHGQNIDQIITSGGAVVAGQINQAQPNIQTVQFNIDDGGNRNQNILASLNQIAQRASRGERFDAINLSQQDFAASGDTQAITAAIANLQNNFGIPVVVAAGNDGADSRNQLAGTAAFVVENSTLGQDGRADTSGVGNIRAEGEFTSQATANVTSRVAQLRSQGYSFQQIQNMLVSEAQREGGSLDRPEEIDPNNATTAPNNNQAAPQQAQWVEHTIQSGDRIWDLVVAKGGSTMEEFKKMNPDVNLDLYHPGTVIRIPPAKAQSAPTPQSAPATPAAPAPAAPAPTPAPALELPPRRVMGGGGSATFF